MVSRILVVALVVCTANAATWIAHLPEKPKQFENKEGCYIEEINDVIPFGAEITPRGHCYRINCGAGMIDYASCGIVSTNNPKCHKTEGDKTKPYPDCCPDFECDFENDV